MTRILPSVFCFEDEGKGDSRSYDDFDTFVFSSTVLCQVADSRPSEDINGNGAPDPGEDQNSNNLIDEDTGVFSIGLAPESLNASFFAFFNPGDPFAFVEIFVDDPDSPSNAILQAIDGAGNTCNPAVQLGPFDPTGNLSILPPFLINIPIPIPNNPNNPPIAFQCTDFVDSGFTGDITPDDFDGLPITPVTGNPSLLPEYTFTGEGNRLFCCVFHTLDGAISAPLCEQTVVVPPVIQPHEFLTGRPKPGKIDLLWTSVGDADEYIILRGEGSIGTNLSPIATSVSTLYVDFDVEPAVVYTYAVQAVGNGGTSFPSKPFEVFIPAIRGNDGKPKTKR